MISAEDALAAAYADLLAGLTYNSRPVIAYALMAPNDAVAPYIIIDGWQEQNDNTKDSFGQKGEINIQVITRFPVGITSKRPANQIANLITKRIKPTPTAEVLNVEGFSSWNTTIEASTTLVQPTGTDNLVRKILTISHALDQIN